MNAPDIQAFIPAYFIFSVSIQRNMQLLFTIRKLNFYSPVHRQHHGKILYHMRTDRHNNHIFCPAVHNGTAAGKRIAGRPGRCRNHQTIRRILLKEPVIDPKTKPCHSPDHVMPYDNVIQYIRQRGFCSVFMADTGR